MKLSSNAKLVMLPMVEVVIPMVVVAATVLHVFVDLVSQVIDVILSSPAMNKTNHVMEMESVMTSLVFADATYHTTASCAKLNTGALKSLANVTMVVPATPTRMERCPTVIVRTQQHLDVRAKSSSTAVYGAVQMVVYAMIGLEDVAVKNHSMALAVILSILPSGQPKHNYFAWKMEIVLMAAVILRPGSVHVQSRTCMVLCANTLTIVP